jgi:hypothetical protein
VNSFDSAYAMFNALNAKGPHEFRNGIVYCVIDGFHYYENVFSINIVKAKCLDIDVYIESPVRFVDYDSGTDSLQSAYDAIANMVKFRAGY